jgi:hypothetical protein
MRDKSCLTSDRGATNATHSYQTAHDRCQQVGNMSRPGSRRRPFRCLSRTKRVAALGVLLTLVFCEADGKAVEFAMVKDHHSLGPEGDLRIKEVRRADRTVCKRDLRLVAPPEGPGFRHWFGPSPETGLPWCWRVQRATRRPGDSCRPVRPRRERGPSVAGHLVRSGVWQWTSCSWALTSRHRSTTSGSAASISELLPCTEPAAAVMTAFIARVRLGESVKSRRTRCAPGSGSATSGAELLPAARASSPRLSPLR